MSRYRRNPDGTFDKVAGSPYAQPNFIGASPSENGEAGTVPAPLAGDENKVLFGDGTWRTPPRVESDFTLPETPTGKYYKDDGTFDNVKNNGYVSSTVESDTSIRSTDQVTIDPELNVASRSTPTTLSAMYSLFKDMLTNVWQADYTEAQTYGDFVEALYSEYDRIELRLHTSNLDLYGDGNEYPITVKMIGEYGKVNPAYPDTDYWKFQGTAHINDNDKYGFNGYDTLKMTIYVNPLDPELPDDLVVTTDNDGTTNYEVTSEDDVCTKVFEVKLYNQDNYEDNGEWNYWNSSFDSTSQSFEFVGTKTEEVYPTPTKYLREDGIWTEPPAGNGISLPETPTGRVYQDDGTFGKKLQVDIVTQNGEYGYIGANDTFIPFKSQADINAAVSAARVGNATAADVVAGKTFTNNSASGLIGTFEGQEKTVTATDSDITVTPDNGKWLSQVNVKPMNLLGIGKLRPSKNLYAHEIKWIETTRPDITGFNGLDIWTDGENVYHSIGTNHYVFDISTKTWSTKTWNGLASFDGRYIWTDGSYIYYSNGSDQYILDVDTSTWTAKIWTGLTSFRGDDVWTDGTNSYYSSETDQYVLDASTSTWTAKTWNGFNSFIGRNVWTDGINMYMSAGTSSQWVLDITTSTWSTKTWTGDMQDINGYDVWTDGINIYYNMHFVMYLYDHYNESWLQIDEQRSGHPQPERGRYTWSDGTNIYHTDSKLGSNYSCQLSIVKTKWLI